MSASLYMQPKQTGEKLINDELRRVLQENKYLGDLPRSVNDYQLMYFQALADANIGGAQKVVDYIEKYGEVELRLEY